jgi:sugar/nucleoside kinase (ribokinase family)
MKNFDLTIAGELNLDLIVYGLPEEMPTERELLATDFRATLGSSSAILAHNFAAVGGRVSFSTVIGSDDFGRIALERLSDAGVDVSHTRRHGTISTGITLLLPHGDRRHILTFPGTISELRVADLDFDFLTQSRHFHLSSLYLQRGLHAGLSDLLYRLKQAGLTLSLDTNDDPEDRWGAPLAEVLPLVDVFMPNEDEVCRMTNCTDLDSAIHALSTPPPVIVVKRGSRGARVYAQGEATDVAPLSVVTVDTVGAGDSFDAGFLRAYLSGKDIITCAKAGNLTGALSTQAPGGTESFRNAIQRETFLREHGYFDLLRASPRFTE